MGHLGHGTDLLLLLGGPITAIPLVLFAYGARRIPYSLVGVLQYIGPTFQFLIATLIFKEPFSGPRVIGFLLIWTALIIYGADGLLRSRKSSEQHKEPKGPQSSHRRFKRIYALGADRLLFVLFGFLL